MLRILDAVRHLQTTKEQTLKAFIKASTLAACSIDIIALEVIES